MQCSFQNEEVRPDGSYISSICINEAKIMITGDPCYGLCYGCAYKQLQAENKQMKEVFSNIRSKLCMCSCCCLKVMEEELKQALKGNRNGLDGIS